MDRKKWMYEAREKGRLSEYIEGVSGFMEVAIEDMRNKGDEQLTCTCVDCRNNKRQPIDEVRSHLIRRGFKRKYTNWYCHGENVLDNINDEVSSVPVSGRNVTNVESFNENENFETFVQNNENEINFDDVSCDMENNENENFDMENNELDELMHDVEAEIVDYPNIFENMSADCKKPLFPNCSKYTKLSAVFKLFNLKAKNGWSDKSFTSLLELLGDMLPENNELPVSTYVARKMLCPLRMEVTRIHACPKDCILYRGDYEKLDSCPTCGTSRFKPNHEHTSKKKRPAAKTVFYLPIEPRIRRLFVNPGDAKLLRWHHDERNRDGMLRHPADCPQWINLDAASPEFESEPRNLRLGLCTDGMNPYGMFSSQKTTWPVMLCVYNLPPWLCMKRKYLMMTLLISGPKQPGNDICVYLAPLIDDLKVLWDKGIEVFDAYAQERFTLRAAVLWTVNDFPAYGNLSGHKVKGKKACPICGSNTCSIRLSDSYKDVYMDHRRFLPRGHRLRQKKRLLTVRRKKGLHQGH